MTIKSAEIKKWNETKAAMGDERIVLGPHYSYTLKHLPRRMLFILARYKFSAKLIGDGKRVLEVGCSEGLGTMILAETAKKVVAVDFDAEAIREAQKSFPMKNVEYHCADFLGPRRFGAFDAVVALDVIEHIYPNREKQFFRQACASLSRYGICIVGTPNKTAATYASATSRIGHINLYTGDRIQETLQKYFHRTFLFGVNDEVVHTGFHDMAHYLIGIGVCKKR